MTDKTFVISTDDAEYPAEMMEYINGDINKLLLNAYRARERLLDEPFEVTEDIKFTELRFVLVAALTEYASNKNQLADICDRYR